MSDIYTGTFNDTAPGLSDGNGWSPYTFTFSGTLTFTPSDSSGDGTLSIDATYTLTFADGASVSGTDITSQITSISAGLDGNLGFVSYLNVDSLGNGESVHLAIYSENGTINSSNSEISLSLLVQDANSIAFPVTLTGPPSGGPLSLSFSGPLTEGSKGMLVVTLDAAQSSAVQVQLSLTPGSAAASEITGLPSSVTIAAGATSVSIPFSIAQNPVASNDPETFTINATSSLGDASVDGNIKEFISTPFAFTQTGGEFSYDASANQMDGSGEVNVSLGAQPGVSLATIENATATYDDSEFAVSGTVHTNLDGKDYLLFQGSFVLPYPGSSTSSVVDSGPVTGKFDLGGLDLTFDQLTFEPGTLLAGFTVSLPFTGGVIKIDTAALGINYGLQFDSTGPQLNWGATVSVPDSGPVDVFGFFTASASNVSLTYLAASDALRLQGEFTASQILGSSLEATIDFTGDNFIQWQNGTPDFVGDLTISGITAPSTSGKAGFGINEIDLSINTQEKTFSGGIVFTFPFGASAPVADVTIDGAWGSGPIVTGVTVAASNLGIIVPDTPDLVWQSVSVGVQNMFTDSLPTTFSGSLGFSFGQQIAGQYIGDLTLSGSGSSQQLTATEQIQIVPYSFAANLVGGALEGLKSIFPILAEAGTVTADFSPAFSGFRDFSFVGTVSVLGNFITTNLNFKADADLDFTIAGQAAVNFGDSIFGKISNITVTETANFLISYQNSAPLASDFAEAWYTTTVGVGIFSTTLTIGLKAAFDGTVSTVFSAPSVAPAAMEASSLGGPGSAHGDSTSSSNYILLTVSWTDAATQPVDLTVTTPSGTVITQSEFAANNIVSVAALSTAYSETLVVFDPSAPAGWNVAASSASALGAVTVATAVPDVPPSILSLSFGGINADGTLKVEYSLANTGGDSTISFFADQDGKNFDGVLLGANANPTDGIGSTNVNLSGLSSGVWHIYALVSDGKGVPQETYSTFTLSVGANGQVDTAPTVNVQNISVFENNSVAASSLIDSISNPSGDDLTQYLFDDTGTDGHFVVNGVVQADGQSFTVSASNLSSVQFVGGATPGADTLQVQIYDATTSTWSASASLTATTFDVATELDAAFTNVLVASPTSTLATTPTITLANGSSVANPIYADAQTLPTLVSGVDSGQITLASALNTIEHYGDDSTTVATIAYQFFTGATPRAAGYGYLVNGGANPNDLDSAYYAQFNEQNRFINFAANLGKNGAGEAAFTAAYGSLDLADAMTQAYADIFGFAPAAGKITAILDATVGTNETREQYFEFYGTDGADGIGTKAAAVGWLMTVAVQADLGTYAASNDAFLAALAGGTAQFNINLLSVYPTETAAQAAATEAFLLDGGQSLSSLTHPLQVADSAANVAANLNALQTLAAASELTSITFTDASTPTLVISAVQAGADASALNAINVAYAIAVTGQASQFNGETIAHFTAQGSRLDVTDLNPNTLTATFTENAAGTQGQLSLSDGTHNATVTLIGQLAGDGFSGTAAAAGFGLAADGGAGTIVTWH